jgi:hypothetical protein
VPVTSPLFQLGGDRSICFVRVSAIGSVVAAAKLSDANRGHLEVLALSGRVLAIADYDTAADAIADAKKVADAIEAEHFGKVVGAALLSSPPSES